MSRGLGIRKVSFPQIIFVLVNNQRPSEQILGLQMRDQIGIMGIFPYKFNVSQIACMSSRCGPGPPPVVARRAYMKMFTGPQTSFAPQIARLVNMEAM
jgi:hypothetical protein